MPGVVLGNHTTVGANSVVTKEFNEKFIVVAGNLSKTIKGMTLWILRRTNEDCDCCWRKTSVY